MTFAPARILEQLRWLALLFRATPFDTSTEGGRSLERYRRAALTSLASLAAKGITLLTTVISVPLTLGYLGAERYGLWMTVSSFIALLAFADLGIGYGLMNAVSEASGRDDREAARRYVASAFFMLCLVGGLLAILFVTSYPLIPWPWVFNVSSSSAAAAEAGPTMAMLAACFLVSLPLSSVQRIQMAYQEGFASSIWMGLGSILGLGGAILAIRLEAGLPWLVLAIAGAPALASLLNGVVLFGFHRTWLWPAWRYVTARDSLQIMRISALFFALQAAYAVAYSSDNLIAAHVLGPEAVTQYSIPMRLFSIVPLMMSSLLLPLWPAYSEALSRGDVAWVTRTLERSLLLSVIVTVPAAALLVAFGTPVIQIWAGPEIIPTFPLLLGLGIWMVLSTAGTAVAMFLNGASVILFQVVIAAALAPTAILTRIWMAQAIGVPGIVWGTVAAYALFVAVPLALFVPRRLFTLARARNGG